METLSKKKYWKCNKILLVLKFYKNVVFVKRNQNTNICNFIKLQNLKCNENNIIKYHANILLRTEL